MKNVSQLKSKENSGCFSKGVCANNPHIIIFKGNTLDAIRHSKILIKKSLLLDT